MMQVTEFPFPLTKRGRLFLKLQNLLAHIRLWQDWQTQRSLHPLLQAVVNILLLLERVDIKMEITKEFERLSLQREQLHNYSLFQTSGKFGETLRSKPLFSQLQKRLVQPGGLGIFDMPALHSWYQLDEQTRHESLEMLLAEIYGLEEIISLIFDQYSQRTQKHILRAERGFATLNFAQDAGILTVCVPKEQAFLYPELSSSSKMAVIKFWQHQGLLESPEPSEESFDFEYTLT